MCWKITSTHNEKRRKIILVSGQDLLGFGELLLMAASSSV